MWIRLKAIVTNVDVAENIKERQIQIFHRSLVYHIS